MVYVYKRLIIYIYLVTKKISATDCATFKKIEREKKLLADAPNIIIPWTNNKQDHTFHTPTHH